MRFINILAMCAIASAMPHPHRYPLKSQLLDWSTLSGLSSRSNSDLSNRDSANIVVATDGENNIANADVNGDINVDVQLSDGEDDKDESEKESKAAKSEEEEEEEE